MRWRLAAAALLALLLGSVPGLAQTPPTIVGPVTVGNCVAFFSPVQIKDAGVVCGGAAGAVQSVGNFASDTSLTIAGVGTGPWNGAVTIKLTTPVTLANGGTNNSLTASNGGIVWSDASKLNILPGTVTAGQCLLSGSSAAPSWGACGGGGGAVSSVSNADGTLTISPTTGAVVASIALAHPNTWTGLQKHIIAGDGILISNNASATALTNQGIDVGEDGVPGSITITTYGIVGTTNMPTFVGQTARGSLASPAAVQTNDVLASFSGRGYIGSGFPASGRGFVRFFAAENWSTTNNGTYVSFAVTPNGTTAPAEALRIENSGGMTVPATVTGGDKGAGSINVGSLFIGGTALTLPVTLANGGTSNGLTASAGGIVWSDASKLNILAGTGTSGLCLLSGASASPSWATCPSGGGAVSSVSNADGSLTISPTTGAVVASLNVAHANTWSAVQTFGANDLILGGVTGSTQCLQANTSGVVTGTGSACGAGGGAVSSVSNADGTLTISPTTGAVVASIALGHANTWSAAQTFNANDLILGGVTGSTQCLQANTSGVVTGTGSACGAGGGGTPGGATTNVQFNNAGAFGGDSGFTYAGAGGVLTLTPAANTAQPMLITGGSTTGAGTSKLGLSVVGTLNTSAAVDGAVLFANVTETQQIGNTALVDIQVGGAPKFQVGYNGWAFTASGGYFCFGITGFNNCSSGMSSTTSTNLFWTVNGNNMLYLSFASGVVLKNTVPIGFASSPNNASTTSIYQGAANGLLVLADDLARTTATQFETFNTVDTPTGPTNYEAGVFGWQQVTNVLTIGTIAGGTGTVRNMEFIIGGTNKLDYGVTNAGGWTHQGTMFAPGLAALSATTTAYVCWTTGTGAVSEDSVSCLSSLRGLKHDIHPFSAATAELMNLKPATFAWNDPIDQNQQGRQLGMVAEEVESVDRMLSTYNKDGKLRGWRSEAMIALLVKGFQEQQKEIETLKRRAAR